MSGLYLTAILPPDQLSEQIEEIRKDCAEKYHVKTALKSPVHITLFRPFRFEEEKEKHLLRILNPISANHQPFSMAIENFDYFNTHVLYLRVIKSEALLKLQHELSGSYTKNKIGQQEVKNHSDFQPHITIAYRDIPATIFPEMWAEYKNKKFKRTFTVDHFSLLKHDGKQWNRFKDYPLKQQDDLFPPDNGKSDS